MILITVYFTIVGILTVFGQETTNPSTLTQTIFGPRTFLPEIVPWKLHRSQADNGDLQLSVDLLYTEDAILSWVFYGHRVSNSESLDLKLNDTIPGEYTLDIRIPASIAVRNTSGSTYSDHAINDVSTNDVLLLQEGEYLVDSNQLFLKLQTKNTPEAAVLKISLDRVLSSASSEIELQDEEPSFPEMEQVEYETVITTPGQRTQVQFEVLFEENDRYSVRGLVYNSTSGRIITNAWTTDYFLGPSPFQRISGDGSGGEARLDDSVRLIDSLSLVNTADVKEILIDIPTQYNDLSGIYTITAHHETNAPGDSGFIDESSLAQFFVFQREDQENGPIPPGVLEFPEESYSKKVCEIGFTCEVTCKVLGLGVTSLELLHKTDMGLVQILAGVVYDYGLYESSIFFLVDSTKPGQSGTYTCVAMSGAVVISKDIDVYFV